MEPTANLDQRVGVGDSLIRTAPSGQIAVVDGDRRWTCTELTALRG